MRSWERVPVIGPILAAALALTMPSTLAQQAAPAAAVGQARVVPRWIVYFARTGVQPDGFREAILARRPAVDVSHGILRLTGLGDDVVSVIVWSIAGDYAEAKAMPTTMHREQLSRSVQLQPAGSLLLHCLPVGDGLRVAVIDATYGPVSSLDRIEAMVRAGARARLASTKGDSVAFARLWPLEYRVCVFSSRTLLLLEQTVRVYPGTASRASLSVGAETGWLEILAPARAGVTHVTLVDQDRGRVDHFDLGPRESACRLAVRRGRHVLLSGAVRRELVIRQGAGSRVELAP